MNEKTEISLALAKSFLDQGHEDMARSIITKLIKEGLFENVGEK